MCDTVTIGVTDYSKDTEGLYFQKWEMLTNGILIWRKNGYGALDALGAW